MIQKTVIQPKKFLKELEEERAATSMLSKKKTLKTLSSGLPKSLSINSQGPKHTKSSNEKAGLMPGSQRA